MDLVKQYIIQCIQTAANNLRLSSEKIEVVALLKEHLSESDSLEEEILQMKKITEFSKFAIKLGEIYNFIAKEKIDFLKLSDQFKLHISALVRELNYLLDVITPTLFHEKMKIIEINLLTKTEETSEEFVEKAPENEIFEENVPEVYEDEDIDSGFVIIGKEVNPECNDEILESTGPDSDEVDFEKNVITPIKQLDSILEQIVRSEKPVEELEDFIYIFEKNYELSKKYSSEIVVKMHKIFLQALKLFKQKELLPVVPVIEGMRACLIVIVALVRGKDVDISYYEKMAEEFWTKINLNQD